MLHDAPHRLTFGANGTLSERPGGPPLLLRGFSFDYTLRAADQANVTEEDERVTALLPNTSLRLLSLLPTLSNAAHWSGCVLICNRLQHRREVFTFLSFDLDWWIPLLLRIPLSETSCVHALCLAGVARCSNCACR